MSKFLKNITTFVVLREIQTQGLIIFTDSEAYGLIQYFQDDVTNSSCIGHSGHHANELHFHLPANTADTIAETDATQTGGAKDPGQQGANDTTDGVYAEDIQ